MIFLIIKLLNAFEEVTENGKSYIQIYRYNESRFDAIATITKKDFDETDETFNKYTFNFSSTNSFQSRFPPIIKPSP